NYISDSNRNAIIPTITHTQPSVIHKNRTTTSRTRLSDLSTHTNHTNYTQQKGKNERNLNEADRNPINQAILGNRKARRHHQLFQHIDAGP
ncbi:hypothetical protein AAHH80_33205, partial [Burkholderia pseudomallei]